MRTNNKSYSAVGGGSRSWAPVVAAAALTILLTQNILAVSAFVPSPFASGACRRQNLEALYTPRQLPKLLFQANSNRDARHFTWLASVSTEDAASNTASERQPSKDTPFKAALAKKGESAHDMPSSNGIKANGSSSGSGDGNITEKVIKPALSCPKVRILKDRMWARETLEDLTASEFACKLSDANANGQAGITSGSTTNFTIASPTTGLFQRKKRAVDFENLLQKLERRIDEMCILIPSPEQAREANLQECYFLDEDVSAKAQGCYSIVDGKGMGSQVYTHEQRRALLLKLLTDRQELLQAMNKAVVQERAEQLAEEEGRTSNNVVAGNYTTKLVSIENVLEQQPTEEENKMKFNEAADLEEIRIQLQGQRDANRTVTAANGDSNLMEASDKISGNGTTKTEEDHDISNEAKAVEGSKASISSPEGPGNMESPNLYVREDGTVDWEGALQDRSALKLFGTSVWARINGQDPASVDENNLADSNDAANGHGEKTVTAKIVETDAIRIEKDVLFKIKQESAAMEAAHLSLLESGLTAGAAVANVNLASLDPALRSRIRESTEALEKKREEVTFQNLVYELERIFVYLDGEMGNTRAGYIPLQDRLNVAEFGLLESQIESLNKQLETGESPDSDVLTIIVDQLNDFKRRLGIDYYVTGLTFDQEAIKRWSADLWEQSKTGIQFYVKGTKLLWNDVVFCSNLIGKAAIQGYILKPREVRTLRRTVKDFFTFIPFVIILIIPLTPIGHVLVFGAIQRFFPDFFPSCYTEQRQNLLQLYESTEYTEVVINETLKEKMVRIVEAMVYFGVEGSRGLYRKFNDMSSAQSTSSRITDSASTSTSSTLPLPAKNGESSDSDKNP